MKSSGSSSRVTKLRRPAVREPAPAQPVLPAALSTTSTSTPGSVSLAVMAVVRPAMPAPMTTTSAARVRRAALARAHRAASVAAAEER